MSGGEKQTFLVVVDESEEKIAAMHYASLQAKKTGGRVALLQIIEPVESINPWPGVEEVIDEDVKGHAREEMCGYEKLVEEISGEKPQCFTRKGKKREVLIRFLEENPDVSTIVLGANSGGEDPGPLVSYLTSAKGIRKLKIPLVIVPSFYRTEEQERKKE